MHSPADSVVRSGKSLAVHIVFALLLYALASLLLSHFDTASEAMREQYEETEVLQLLAGARATIVGWYVAALAISWLCSTVFLVTANLKRPHVRSKSDARKAMPVWIAMFVVAIVATAFLWWRQVSLADVASTLLDDDYLLLATAGYVGTALAFWLGTGLAVALTLKPSVPMASTALPEIWN